MCWTCRAGSQELKPAHAWDNLDLKMERNSAKGRPDYEDLKMPRLRIHGKGYFHETKSLDDSSTPLAGISRQLG